MELCFHIFFFFFFFFLSSVIPDFQSSLSGDCEKHENRVSGAIQ